MCYVLCQSYGNYEAITYSRFTKDKEKRIKAYHHGKLSFHNGKQQESEKET